MFLLRELARVKWALYTFYTLFSKREYCINRMLVLHSIYWDEEYYRQKYAKYLQEKSILPIDHYLKYGWKIGCNPSAYFNNNEYLSTFPFVNTNPLVHYLKIGRFGTYGFTTNYLVPIQGQVQDYLLNVKKNKKAIYTCIVNGYDDLIVPYVLDTNWDYICFTDNQQLIEKGNVGPWKIRPLVYNEGSFTHICRFHKIMAHIALPDYQESIWIDGQVNIISSYLYDYVAQTDLKFLSAPHGENSSIFGEAKLLIKHGIVKNVQALRDQIKRYKQAGFPRVHQPRETCVVYRKHQDTEVIQLMEKWWYWVKNFSQRDQISLPYVLWETGMDKSNPAKLRNAFVAYQDFLVIYHKKGREDK